MSELYTQTVELQSRMPKVFEQNASMYEMEFTLAAWNSLLLGEGFLLSLQDNTQELKLERGDYVVCQGDGVWDIQNNTFPGYTLRYQMKVQKLQAIPTN